MTLNPDGENFGEVFTVTDYYDGPRQGIANYGGRAHFYDCIFSDEKQDYSDLYRLTPITDEIFQMALEDWAIWLRWEHAFKAGQTDRQTHPALPEDLDRHNILQSVLVNRLKSDLETSIIRSGQFRILRPAEIRDGMSIDLLVKWSEPGTNHNAGIWAD